MSRVPFAELFAPSPLTPEPSRSSDSVRAGNSSSSDRSEGEQPPPLPPSLSRIPELVGEAIAAAKPAAVDTAESGQSDDERALAAALTDILARKPTRARPPVTPAAVAEADDSDLAPDGRHIPVPVFVSALGCTTTASEAEPFDDVPTARDDTAQWLAAARRRHVKQAVTRAGSWIATVLIGSTIVAIAAVLLFGLPLEIGRWLGTASRVL